MFRNQSAWFSTSVEKDTVTQWEKEKGEIVSLLNAQFIFSEDAESADTKKIYSSDAYIDEHLAVFHALYIRDCVEAGTKLEVPLGKYFLPPKEVQDVARKQMKFKWDDLPQNKKFDKPHLPKNPKQENATWTKEAVHIRNLPKVTGIIEDFIPGLNGCEVYQKSLNG